MYFELRIEWRKLTTGAMYCRWAFGLVAGKCISRVSEPHGEQCGHTCVDSAGVRAEAVMSKIESWLEPIGNGRRPPSKLHGAESFDKDHGPAALGTSPERPWCAGAFFRGLGFEEPA